MLGSHACRTSEPTSVGPKVPDITPIRPGDSVPLLHADEPTSGLDARAAATVIRTVRKFADSVNGWCHLHILPLYADEPTSGLDARAAATVIRTVRNIADSGRTVVVTVHQPSIDIFNAFDSLLLLARGGRTVYFGPLGYHSRDLIAYLEAIPGVVHIGHGYNPAVRCSLSRYMPSVLPYDRQAFQSG